jgi:hypothetical protein
MRFLSRDARWKGKLVVAELASCPEIEQAGEMDLNPDFSIAHCIPPEVMARLNAFW